MICFTYEQQYTQEQKGMSISMFQFNPLSLGVTDPKPKSHHPKPHLHLRKSHVAGNQNLKQTIVAQKRKDIPSGNARKNETDPTAMNKTLAHHEVQGAIVDTLRNSSTTTNSTKAIDKESNKKLKENPTPSNNDALEHLKNVKFDGTHKNISTLLANNTKGGLTAGNSTNTTANSTVNLPKEELLFYKNKTKDGVDGSEELNSVKLIKTTTPDSNNGELPILQTINATVPTNASLNNNATAKLNKSSSFNNNSSTINLKNNTTASTFTNQTRTSIFMVPKNASLLPDEGQTVFDVRKRQEILRHFIPVMEVSNADRRDSFQSGSRKHKLHHMFPECYHCPKQSNYTSCVKKAKLMKCDEGLNNICYTKSHKHDGEKRHISYEMGCTSHKECGTARAFPCKGLYLFDLLAINIVFFFCLDETVFTLNY